MGLKNRVTKSNVFVRFNSRDGVFQTGSGDKKATYSDITDVKLRKVELHDDEYDGQPRTDLRLFLENTDSNLIVDFNIATALAAKLASSLTGANLEETISLAARQYKAGSTPKGFDKPLDSDMVFLSAFQNDAYLKQVVEVPKAVMVKVGNKEVADTSAREELIKELVVQLQEKLATAASKPAASAQDEGVPAE